MDRKEAADLLDNLIGMVDDSHGADYDTALRMAINALRADGDIIYRKAAIDELAREDNKHPFRNMKFSEVAKCVRELPPAQPERLADDDFETIRIHLNAYKEKLCNQQRWKEADEYQRIIDRFMAFASAQPELDEWCTDCKEYDSERHCCPRWNRVIKSTLEDAKLVRKKGTWVQTNPPWKSDNIVCDQCGYDSIAEFDYCPNCGARMMQEGEEDDKG